MKENIFVNDKKEKLNKVLNENMFDKNNDNKDTEDLKKEMLYDLFFGITLPGRIILTLYSFHGLFFIYNIIIQYIILIPGLLYDVDSFTKSVYHNETGSNTSRPSKYFLKLRKSLALILLQKVFFYQLFLLYLLSVLLIF